VTANGYGGYDIKQLFQMVDEAKNGLAPSRQQYAALQRATQMLGAHAEALQGYRDQLAAKWPPESNAASAAYLVELDKLVAAAKETALTSAVNANHVNLVVEAIEQAHITLKPLHDEYVKNEGLLQQYDAKVSAAGYDYEFVGGPGAGAAARGLTRLFTSSPVDDGRQEELVRQARQAMVPLTGAAQDGGTYIVPPAPYAPPTVAATRDEFTRIGGDSTGGASRPPVIAPPAHTRATTGAEPGSPTQPSASVGTVAPHQPEGGAGPVLGGVIVAPASPATPSAPVLGQPGVGPVAPGLGPMPPGVLPGLGIPIPGGGTPLAPRATFDNNSIRGGAGSGVGITKPLAPGNVVGGAPMGMIGGAPPRGSSTADSPVQRVNPVGGIIGQQSGGRSGSRGPSVSRIGSPTLLGPHQGRHGHSGKENEEQKWDPDNPWATDVGVSPVIRPDTTAPTFDPGPGVIGLDR
jgi:hypothetical protein